MKETIVTLFIAGLFGSLVRLIMNPEPSWQAWMLRFVVGISCAVFLGGLFGHLLVKWFHLGDTTDAEWAIAGAGFVTGTFSEQILDRILTRLQEEEQQKKKK